MRVDFSTEFLNLIYQPIYGLIYIYLVNEYFNVSGATHDYYYEMGNMLCVAFFILGENRVREIKEIKEYMVGIITKLSKFTKHTIFISLTPNFLSEECRCGLDMKRTRMDST